MKSNRSTAKTAFGHETLRQLNTETILSVFYENEVVSRRKLLEVSGIAAPTVWRIVEELKELQLVSETGSARASRGRRPVLLALDHTANYGIVIDLAEPTLQAAIYGFNGTLSGETRFEQQRLDRSNLVSVCHQLVDGVIQQHALASEQLLGIGIALPGVVDRSAKKIIRAGRLAITAPYPFAAELESQVGFPVFLGNVTSRAGIAEQAHGKTITTTDMLYLHVGSGIRAAPILDGEVFLGQSLDAGQIGHTIVHPGGVLCYCGRRGCLETTASTQALLQAVERLVPSCAPLRSAMLSWLFAGESEAAEAIVTGAAHDIALTIANTCTALGLTDVCVSIRAEPIADAYFAAIEKQLQTMVGGHRPVRLWQSRFRTEAPLLGAGLLLRSRLLHLARRRREWLKHQRQQPEKGASQHDQTRFC